MLPPHAWRLDRFLLDEGSPTSLSSALTVRATPTYAGLSSENACSMGSELYGQVIVPLPIALPAVQRKKLTFDFYGGNQILECLSSCFCVRPSASSACAGELQKRCRISAIRVGSATTCSSL
jgi:hypothetical protein